MMKKISLTLLTAAAAAAVPFAIAPLAQADLCGAVGGRHVEVGGCTPGIVGGVADAAVAGAAAVGVADAAGAAAVANDAYGFPPEYVISPVPYFPGEIPCVSPTGMQYYTPGAAPCY